jgi:hypothetical protein
MVRQLFIWILIIVSFICLGLDVWAFKTPEKGDTLSEIMLNMSKKYPILAFFCGLLIGHFYWPQNMD